tara:strand:- start:8958 stop:9731 length:774 start_codon:yes stop_codon:yes gene_type:complete
MVIDESLEMPPGRFSRRYRDGSLPSEEEHTAALEMLAGHEDESVRFKGELAITASLVTKGEDPRGLFDFLVAAGDSTEGFLGTDRTEDTPTYLEAFRANNEAGKVRDLSPYNIRYVHNGTSNWGSEAYDIPADYEYISAMLWSGTVVGFISFTTENGGLMIGQVQRGDHCDSGILTRGVKWERALIKGLYDDMVELGVPEIRGLPYHRNIWPRIREREIATRDGSRVPLGKLIYDVNFERSGMKYDKGEDMFIRRAE